MQIQIQKATPLVIELILRKKIGKQRFERLELLASQKVGNKTNRFYLIEIIEKYKQ